MRLFSLLSEPGRERILSRRWMALSCLALLWAPAVWSAPVDWISLGPLSPITSLATANTTSVLGFRPHSTIFAGVAGEGVLRSDDSGLSWVSAGSGLEGHDAVTIAVSQVSQRGVDATRYDTTVYAGTAGSGVFRLGPFAPGDPEPSWVLASTGLTSLDVRVIVTSGNGVVSDPSPPPVVYAGTAGGLFASKDGGDTWVAKTAGLPSGQDAAITALAADPLAPLTLYAGTLVGLFRSVDGGETWSKRDTSSAFILSVSAIAVDPLVTSRIYAAGFKSFPCSPFCLPVAFMPVAVRSTDGGATWTPMDGLAGFLVRAFAATSTFPSRVFAGTSGNGVFESSDAGAAWSAANNGLVTPSVSSLAIDPVLPSLLFAGTSEGAFRAPLAQVAVPCAPNPQIVCFSGRRFSVFVSWVSPDGHAGLAQAVPLTDKTGAFWFFDAENLELVVKVLDGRGVNGKFWVFYGSMTNVAFTMQVTDTLTGAVKTYINSQGQMASVADTSAF